MLRSTVMRENSLHYSSAGFVSQKPERYNTMSTTLAKDTIFNHFHNGFKMEKS